MSADDPMAGLDPEEIADVHRRSAMDGSSFERDRGRIIRVLLFFVVSFAPLFVGSLWLAEQAVYHPLCARADLEAPVADVEIDVLFSDVRTVGANASNRESTCMYANGQELPLAQVIAAPAATALDVGTSIVALGLPFVATAGFAAVARRRASRGSEVESDG